MTPSTLYITGTDTGIGKTRVSCALLCAYAQAGNSVLGMKPVASGCEQTEQGLRNEDALQLMAASASKLDYATVNPYAFADPIAPHLAAADEGVEIKLDVIADAFSKMARQSDVVVVEGVGGWCAPLGSKLTQADLVHALKLPVILVVGLRLGCLNHALLSVRAIQADGCRLLGWIANCTDPDMLRCEDNINALRERIEAPQLGTLGFGSSEISWRDGHTPTNLRARTQRSP